MSTSRRALVLVLLSACFTTFAAAQFPKVKIPKPSNPLDKMKEQTQPQRQRAGTPEVVSALPDTLTSGKTADVELTLNNFPVQDGTATAKDGTFTLPGGIEMQGHGVCQNLTNVHAQAPNKIKFTITPTAGGTSCNVGLHARSAGYVDAYFKVIDTETARRKEEAEKMQRDAMDQQKKAMGIDKANFGKVWNVSLPGGKKDTWTYVGDQSNGMMKEFKNAAGEKVMMMYYNGMVQIQVAGNCVMTGTLANNRVQGGHVIQCPGMSMNDPWSAVVQ